MDQHTARENAMTTPARGTLINPMARHLDAIGGPLRVARAEGVRLYDDSGHSWIDCETGSGVFGLGHRNAAIAERSEQALAKFDLGNHHLISGERATLAYVFDTELSVAFGDILLSQLGKFFGSGWPEKPKAALTPYDEHMRFIFNVSAGESVDCAIKLARGATGKSTIVCADNAYHGCSGYALAASAPSLGAALPVRPPGFVHVPYGPVDAIAFALEQDRDVAAVLLQPVAIEAGCIVPPDGYLCKVWDLCRERGVLLIVDEAATGLGRTGSVLACAAQWVVPDILVVGHALSGGAYPIYATCYRKDREQLDAFHVHNPFVHISTFGGGEVGCTVARLALLELSEAALVENVRARGDRFRQAAAALLARGGTPLRAVHGAGLANALELDGAQAARALQRALFERGVLCRPALLSPQSLLFLPPLSIGDDDMTEVTDAIGSSLSSMPGAP